MIVDDPEIWAERPTEDCRLGECEPLEDWYSEGDAVACRIHDPGEVVFDADFDPSDVPDDADDCGDDVHPDWQDLRKALDVPGSGEEIHLDTLVTGVTLVLYDTGHWELKLDGVDEFDR